MRTHLETPHELIGAQVVVDGLAADRVDNLAAHRWLGCVVLEGDSINSIEWNEWRFLGCVWGWGMSGWHFEASWRRFSRGTDLLPPDDAK